MIRIVKKYCYEIIGAVFCLGFGILSGYIVNSGKSDWYIHIVKPGFNPPSWVFAPVWSVLYIMMGIALGKILKLKSDNKSILLSLFTVQFILNIIWSPIFFYYHRIDLALYDICLLWLTIVGLTILARHIKIITFLFLPYLCWVSFALILNLAIFRLNYLFIN
jgi:benzodiazapine receptor